MVIRRSVRTVAASQRFSRNARIDAAQRDRNRRGVPLPTRPRSVQMDSAGTVLAVAGGCRAVEAARDTLPHPVHVAFVTKHARTPGSADGSHRVACCYGLVAQTVCCRDRPARLRGLGTRGRRGWPPAALSQDRCVALAGREPCGRPVVAAFGRHVPVANGESGMASRRCAGRVSPVRALRGCRRAGGRRRPRYASCHMALAASSRAGAAYGCPGSGVGAPLL